MYSRAGHAGDTAGAAWPTQAVDIYSNRLSPGERYRSAWVTGGRRDTTAAAAAEARRDEASRGGRGDRRVPRESVRR